MSKIKIPEGSRAVATFGDWTLYELRPAEDNPSYSFLWVRFKLMLPSETQARQGRRRVVWLSWNPLALRFARGADLAQWQTQQPDLYAEVVLFLELTYDRSWLMHTDGRTAAEIDAEVGRLSLARALAAQRKKAARRNGESV